MAFVPTTWSRIWLGPMQSLPLPRGMSSAVEPMKTRANWFAGSCEMCRERKSVETEVVPA